MIINIAEFNELKEFFSNGSEESRNYAEENCCECIPEENNKCQYKEICLRYYPKDHNGIDYKDILIQDLFDTIEFLLKNVYDSVKYVK